jgi:hypothetical protein
MIAGVATVARGGGMGPQQAKHENVSPISRGGHRCGLCSADSNSKEEIGALEVVHLAQHELWQVDIIVDSEIANSALDITAILLAFA